MTRLVCPPQRAAFLDMLSQSEGTFGIGDDGYNVLVGSTKRSPQLFPNYERHPNILVTLTPTLKSTAAGRYQLLYRYWKAYIVTLGLQGFEPATQDRIALQQIREQDALAAIDAGDLQTAIAKCANIWASLPGAGYGQREHKYSTLAKFFVDAGGVLS